MLGNHSACKYKTPYKGLFLITHCWTNDTVLLKYGAIKIRYNIHRIKPYKYDTNAEYINPENMCDDVNI